MSVEDKNTIDFASIDPTGNAVFLTISDHLDWDNERSHFDLLKNKINAYVNAVEGGDFYKKYPLAIGKKVVIDLVCKYQPPPTAESFLQKLALSMKPTNYEFRYKILD
jgi:hypothetical protein